MWHDLDADSADDGEPGLTGWTVRIQRPNGAIVSTTTTTDGTYRVDRLDPGMYEICVEPQAGFVPTSGPDSLCRVVTVAAGEHGASGFGFYKVAIIGGRVLHDADADGQQDYAERGITGLPVTLVDGAGSPVATTVTDTMGDYSFPDLRVGTHTVCIPAPVGYRFVWDADGLSVPGCVTVSIASGQNRRDVDFGYQKYGSIGDRVWLDQDGDGIQDLREVGMPGVVVTLKLRTGQFVAQAVTSDAGLYLFAQLLPGNYSVCVDTPPGHVRTRPVFSSCSSVMLLAGQARLTIDFGFRPAP